MANDAQKTYRKTEILKVLDAVEVILGQVEVMANKPQTSQHTRPLMPAAFRRRVSGLVTEVNKRALAIKAEEVT